MDDALLSSVRWHREPKNVGMAREALLEAVAALEMGRAAGQHPAAQLYVSRLGRPLLEFACGDSLAGGAVTPDSVLPWFSSCKPLTAMAIAWLYERGRLDLDDPVVRYIPEFGNGKERCTVRHVLTHQGGFPSALSDRADKGWAQAIAEICAAPAEHAPGARAAYHHVSGWYILGELVRRIDGRPIERFLAEEFFHPLEMRDSHMGISPEAQRALGPRLARVALGRSDKPPYVGDAFVTRFNSTAEIGRVNPSGGMRGPARDLGRFYEMLLAKGESPQGPLLRRSTVELFTACHRWGLPDQTLANAPLAWGLGFGLHGNSDLPTSASRRVFCHSGMVSSVGMGDPERQLACVVLTTGLLDPMGNARRLRAVTGAALRACDTP
jgi:CubicO group peptidase (beta-lactamase class C family)